MSAIAGGADATMVLTEVDPEDAGRYGVVRTAEGRVTEYVYKPDEPATLGALLRLDAGQGPADDGFTLLLGLFDSTITYRAQFQARRELAPLPFDVVTLPAQVVGVGLEQDGIQGGASGSDRLALG